MINLSLINLPTCLTIFRLLLSPVLLPVILIHFLPLHSLLINSVLTLTFVLISFTDFLDGYFARLYRQETNLGRLLDPIADKILVFSTLVALVHVQKLNVYWPIIIIGRDFFVMGLREIALHQGFSVPVLPIGKIKTGMQIATLAFIILNPVQSLGWQASYWNKVELTLLCATFLITILSGIYYYQQFIRLWQQKNISTDSLANS